MIRLSISVLILILSSGCAHMLPQGGSDAQQRSLTELQHWQVRGKLSVTTPDDNVTGYLTWQQQHTDFDLFISGPFGQGASRLQGNEQQAQLALPGWDNPATADTPEQLMAQYLGWHFPVHDIRHWVKGQPSPNYPADIEYSDLGLTQRLQQHGWEIRFSRYSLQQGYWLPGLIRMQGHDLRFTFAIREWTLHD